ncbi:hypothetical protein HMN09_00961800 [Mycena chlorophos]|uniref:Uncharacterized protein n=1 Tax=Mycena chlorophos TaxID=658473 RepID=A0A8H6W1I9_MYCCL|nr:hypothetical protein HMN09_00961800 [Mycena chlorophos]
MTSDNPDVLEQLIGLKILLQEQAISKAECGTYQNEHRANVEKHREETEAHETELREMLEVLSVKSPFYSSLANHREHMSEMVDFFQHAAAIRDKQHRALMAKLGKS